MFFCSTAKYAHFMIYSTELIDKQQPINYYMCFGGEGHCELLVNLADFLFIVHAILLFQVHP